MPPEDPRALAEAFGALAANPEVCQKMGAMGRKLARERYGREPSVDRWRALLTRVAAQQALR